MINEKDSTMLREQLSHQAYMQHQEEMNYIIQKQESHLVVVFGLKPYMDGDQWCYLLGENIQEGICGFGDTPFLAMLDFNKNFTTTRR